METLILIFKFAIIVIIIAFAAGFLCSALYCKKNKNCYCCKFAMLLTNIFFLGLFLGTMFLMSSGVILAIAIIFLLF